MKQQKMREEERTGNRDAELSGSSGSSQALAVRSSDEQMQAATEVEAVALAATGYKVIITMTEDTVKKLKNGGFFLYGFKAVQSEAGGGYPLVWFKSQTFGLQTIVAWQVQYQAYTSLEEIVTGGTITASNPYDADLGDILYVETQNGMGSIIQGGPTSSISIKNQTQTEFTCGISEVGPEGSKPMCAFPLYGMHANTITPIEKVVLTFASEPVNTGQVIQQAFSTSLKIDLTGAPGNSRTVEYAINTGWKWGGSPWAKQIEAGWDLVPVLIESGA
jgi:hypothetical protein